ncbi:MAG TPA: xanthine dehydrogenase family protein molybdopterin-binding subunit [Candidatus Micrarchaeia archaeon]|nr:xanthine dehydrogenase family protein molybdopterin-binding subunit [Candidatus Micrarchaeia archaeon]
MSDGAAARLGPLASGLGAPRLEGRGKVTGRLRYTDDLRLHGLCHVRLVVSDLPHARIVGVDAGPARSVAGVVAVVVGADLPTVSAPGPDQPLARDEVFYVGQPVAAVVAETESAAEDAAQLVAVRLEPLPFVVDPEAAMADGAPPVLGGDGPGAAEAGVHGAVTADGDEPRPPNCAAATRIRRGDPEGALARAAVVVRGRYEVAAAHQGFLEPHTVAAEVGPDGVCTIWSPTQGAFLSRRITCEMLGWAESRVRVVPMPVGGGFGGKILLLEPLAALLADRVGRPVRLTLTRTEEFLLGRGGPGATIDLTLAAGPAGDLLALHGRVVFDCGAGSEEHAATALDLLASTYRIPDLDLLGYDVATHKTPATAYRAPAAPQAFFALESALDQLAAEAQLDPLELRLAHAPDAGDVRPDGRTWPAIGLRACLERARDHPLWREPVPAGEGVGLAVGCWGGGLEPAAAACRVERDGTLVLQLGASDLTGSHTTLAGLAAQAAGLTMDRVRVELGDTGSAPYAGVAGGSKTLYSVGPAVLQAGEAVRRQLLEIAAGELEAAVEDLELQDGVVVVRGSPAQRRTVAELAALAQRFGGRYPPVEALGRVAIRTQAPMFTVHLARAQVDRATGAIAVTGYAAVQDVGRALHPAEIEGQVHGGVLQGLGRALGEALVWDRDGQLRTASFADYLLPTIEQAPPIAVELVEVPSPDGPMGARGVGEPPAIPGVAAVANAVYRATGVRLRTVPFDTSALTHGPSA